MAAQPGIARLLGFVITSAWRLVQALTSHSLDFADDVADKKAILMHRMASHGVKSQEAMAEHHIQAAAFLEGSASRVRGRLLGPHSLSLPCL